MSQIVDSSTRALTQSAAQLQKLAAELPKTVETQVAVMLENENKLADQQAAIAANEKALETQEREAAAELRLRVKEDADEVLGELLDARGLITTTRDDLRALEVRAQKAEAEAAAQVEAAVKATTASLTAKHTAETNALKAQHDVALATYKANATADQARIESLTGQVDQLREDIKAERQARIDIAEANSKAAATVINTGK